MEIDGQPRIKLSQDVAKLTIPGRKTIYRLLGGTGNEALIDLIQSVSEPPPEPGKRILCRHPFEVDFEFFSLVFLWRLEDGEISDEIFLFPHVDY